MNFKQFSLTPALYQAIEEVGYTKPTPIQEQTIPVILAGTDIIGCAQTGTGKTAAFAIPILQRLITTPRKNKAIQALVLVPTRELALQVEKNFKAYSTHLSLKTVAIFGGVPLPPQVRALRQNPEVVIATPGRLLDLIQQKIISISQISTLVLDEADQMLDMGFIHDIKKVLTYVPQKRQTLFFSATMPAPIEKFAKTILYKPTKIEVTPPARTADKVEQEVYFTSKEEKRQLLSTLLQTYPKAQTLVFTRTKHGANNLVKFLQKVELPAVAIHGNKSQNARVAALNQFKDKSIRILIATDIAARGIDIEQLPLVINFDIPNIAETYVHRIGRTGRAGATGLAISLCTPEEKKDLLNIQKLTGTPIRAKKITE
ncbi:MAG: DEAD/DEAH box helicase [Flavobacteriaceae bacterium]|jgi:ATP-dependent RNA helicase RhlE|nr:DEAD/DEAH box helicase [Flavobacteriaceae bacterium]